MEYNFFSKDDVDKIKSRKQLLEHLKKNKIEPVKINYAIQYEEELKQLQRELLKLQNWILKYKKRVVVVFEGRDAAGKGGSIRRFIRYLNPRSMRVVALNKPTDIERGQWYFRRHVKELPNPGEIVFFDRSWYNRAVVEPVMGFCTKDEYDEFLQQVPEFEHMLHETGVHIIKLWFSISKEEQNRRFESRKKDPLKQWKLSPIDKKSQGLWDRYTYFKLQMFSRSHTNFAPWIIIDANSKKRARLESIRYVLSLFDYDGKIENSLQLIPDPNIVKRYNRSLFSSFEKK